MTLLFKPLSEDGTPLCSKGLHAMTEENTGWKKRPERDSRSRYCRTCSRAAGRERQERRRATAGQLNPIPKKVERYEIERWEADGHLYVKVATERFEYVSDEDYLLKARRILGNHVRKTGWRQSPGIAWIEEVDRERDYANPAWSHSITYRTIAPVLALQGQHSEAA